MATVALQPLDQGERALEIGGRHGEGDVGGAAVLGDVLDDHVDVDGGVGERAEDRRGDARPVLARRGA